MMLFQLVGIAFVSLLLLLLILFVLYFFLRKDVHPLMADEEMPVLLPIPIPTKNRPFVMRVLVWLFDIRKWQLADNWHFKLENGVEIVLPKDFRFDGASIPRIFWAVLSPVGLLLIPGLIHDYGYRFDQVWQENENGEVEPYMQKAGRKAWDDLFKTVALQVNGFAGIDFVAWAGLRLGGCCAGRKHRKAEEPPLLPKLNPAP